MLRTFLRIGVWCGLLGLTMAAAQPAAAPTYQNLNAVLWMQTSVEYRAVALQSYRAAESALLRGLRDKRWTAALEQTGNFETLPPAVVLDLDETVLDNSAFEARRVVSGKAYSEDDWQLWVNEQRAGLVPGAKDFLRFAKAHGAEPIYVTDRVCDPSKPGDATVGVLQKLQVPLETVSEQLICATSPTDKQKSPLRAALAAKYRIVLLIGDSLTDFVAVPKESATLQGRQAIFAAHQNLWGTRWIVLPNPTYGGWENAIGNSIPEKLAKLRK